MAKVELKRRRPWYWSLQKNLASDSYFNKEGELTLDGVKCATTVLMHGLICNIEYANSRGLWKDFEHMQHIVEKLGQDFAAQKKMDITNLDL